jgi:tetratricopeptide (TPR) repeat protein
MTRWHARGARAVLLAAVLAADPAADLARADTPTNGWDAVRDPAAAERYALHVRVRQMLVNTHPGPPDPTLHRARTLLEQAGAASSPDVRLRFDLGEVYAALDDNVRAKAILQPAVDAAPDHPAAVEAFITLANAYAKLDQSDEERRVYERFLPKVTDERSRSTAMLNLAEAHMHLGDLEASIAGYRATIDLAAQLPNLIELAYHTGALAVWGLAVALDRANDIPSGAKEAKLALVLDHDMAIIRLNPSVFFSPARERNWYVALGFTEYAKDAEDARAAATWWQRAEGCWREYVDDAVASGEADHELCAEFQLALGGFSRVLGQEFCPRGDLWIDIARARLERARAQRVAAERRAKGRIVYPPYECVR